MIGLIYFFCAIFFICLAHFIRVLRWELFIDIYERPDRKDLLEGLSVGYLLNYIIPFKLGDIVRAWFSGRKMKNGTSLGLSTVIVDRYLDIVCVGLIFVALSMSGVGGIEAQDTAFFYVALALVVMILMVITFFCKGIVKKIIRVIAGVFNPTIETAILKFAWALIWNFKDIFQKISKVKLLLTTIGMWIGYLFSYYLFASFLRTFGEGTTWTNVFFMLFAQNGIKESTGSTIHFANDAVAAHPIYMACYIIVPVIILLAISLLVPSKSGSADIEETYLNLLPHLDPQEKLNFLENYFSNSNREYIKNYLKISQDISIIRDYSAGSNATTMLCTDGERTFFRKYAFGEEGEKLYQQILWIEANKDRIALPEILKKEQTDVYCYYDMAYSSNSVGLFEYAHSMPVDQVWTMIQRVLERLEGSIYRIDVRKADKETIHKYIQSKVEKNLDKIKNAKRIKNLQQYDTIYINGVEYRNLPFYGKYLNEEYLSKVFKNDTYAVIHGDLTIENIICTRDAMGQDDFYIIDPNTGNVHDSPNLDYGKLLQSIHGGYEFLMSAKEVKVSENRINFLFTRSSAYIELHNMLRNYMKEKLGDERTRSIYFHEIIHWLRLMPYKIEKDSKRALLFYAGMLMVLNDVINMYGDGEV